MTRWPTSLRSRLALWYTVLLGVPLITFAVACYFVFSQTLLARTDRFIGDALTAFSRELVAERRAAGTIRVAAQSTVDEVRFRDLYVAILDPAGNTIAATAETDNDGVVSGAEAHRGGLHVLDTLRAHDRTKPFALTLSSIGGASRLLSRPVEIGGESLTLAGTYSLADNEVMLARIREMFLIAIPILILCAASGGYIIARRSLAPVADMAVYAAEISATNLHQRLPVGGGDELVGLAQVINDLLDRLEQAFAQQRRFVADASHELRTPASILRTEADVTLSREHRTEEEYRASVVVMQDAARRLGRVVDDLFLLARADAGHLVAHRAPLYLEEVVHDVTRAVRSVADLRGVQVELRRVAEAPFDGDADLLGRLLLNLLDNAIKHSPDGATVTVELWCERDAYLISVTDAGQGIPPEAAERVFERFFRVDAARSRVETSSTSGAGLGLPIARRIAEIHGGRLEMTASRPGHTSFQVTLPASAETAGSAAFRRDVS